MIENWKPVPGYEGLYEVSDKGNVRSLNYRGNGETKLLSPALNKKGYKHVGLHKDKKTTTFQVHRLVALAFIPNPDNLPQVNHKDKNTGNNCVENLEWCDGIYNIRHAQGRLGVFENYIKNHNILGKIRYADGVEKGWYLRPKSVNN